MGGKDGRVGKWARREKKGEKSKIANPKSKIGRVARTEEMG
jgi:hypothetical protein